VHDFLPQYWQLFVLRTLTGISIGGALPLCFSLLGDMYPANKRYTLRMIDY
jgi:MFS family permease